MVQESSKKSSAGGVTRRTDGRWQGSYQQSGVRRFVYGKSEHEVRQKLRALVLEVGRNGTLSRPGTKTVADLLDAWLAARGPALKPKTFDTYRSLARRYIIPVLGRTRLSNLRPEHLQALYTGLQSRGLRRAPSQVHQVFFNSLELAVRWGWVASNPARRAVRPPYRQEQQEVWSIEELTRFLTETAEDRWHGLWALLAGSGLRIGEALALGWDRVDLESGTVTVTETIGWVPGGRVRSRPKTSAAERVVIVPAFVVAAMVKLKERQVTQLARRGLAWRDDMPVFEGRGEYPLDYTVARRALVKSCVIVGVPVIRLHQLRHLHASVLLDQGLPLPAVASRLGHRSSLVTAAVYSHRLPGQDARAATAMERALGGRRGEMDGTEKTQ